MKNKLIYVFFAVTALLCCFAFSAFAGYDLDSDAILELDKVENYDECYASGDVNGSGAIEAGDARIILRISVNLENIDASSFIKADVDGDGEITAKDARTALRLSVGLDKMPEHDIEEIVIVPSTCASEGLTVRICKSCVKIYAKVTVPAEKDGHITNGRWTTVKAPNCKEEGLGQLKCILCQTVLKEEAISKLSSHSGEWTYPAGKSCLDPYIAQRACDVCGYEEAKTINPPGGCDYKWIVTQKATCTENGEKIYKCTYCEKENNSEVITATGHLFERTVLVKESTCDENGLIADACVNCDATENERQLAPKGHNFDNIHYAVKTEPTCSSTGLADVFCLECSLSTTIDLPMKEHTLEGEWNETLAPTCTTAGEAEGVCEYCGDVTKEITATGHTVTSWVNTKPATCSETGIRTGYCSVCKDEAATEEVAKLPHKYDESRPYRTNGVPCKEVWEGYYMCKTCDAKQYFLKSQLPSCTNANKGQTKVTEATCTERKTTVSICDFCNEEIAGSSRKSGTALGHNYPETGTETKAATCIEDGTIEYTCTRTDCGHTKTETVKSTGHSISEEVIVSEATCTQGTVKNMICSICKEVCAIVVGDPLPHTEVKTVIADSASLAENGNYIVKCKITCSVCQTVISEEETATRLELENDEGLNVVFSSESGLNPGDEVIFTVNSESAVSVTITYGGEGYTDILMPDGNGEYSFTIPTDLGAAETITIVVTKNN